MVQYIVERARAAHAQELRAIERAAGARFKSIGMPEVAKGEPTPATILEDRAHNGRLYLSAVRDGLNTLDTRGNFRSPR